MKQLYARLLLWLPVCIVLVLGAYLRLHRISEYMTFLGDEGRDVLIVKRMIVDGKWTLLGPTASVGGFYMGPMYYYFMLPFLWMADLDPVGPAVMVALVGIATILLLYQAGSYMFNRRTGFIAAALYAVSPIVISYSRSSWNPNIVPFFSLLCVYLSFLVAKRRAWHLLFWIGLIFGVGVQLHYTFLFLLPVVVFWLLMHGRSWGHIKWYGLMIVGFIIGFSPFLAFELRHEFTNTRGIIAFVLSGKDTGFVFLRFIENIRDVSFRIFGRLVLRFPDTMALSQLTHWQRTLWTQGTWIVLLISLFSLFRRLGNKASTLVLLWFSGVTILFGLYGKSIYDYYFGVFFALPFLSLAAALDAVMGISRFTKVLALAAFLFLVVFNWMGRPFLYTPNNQLGQTKTIAAAVLEHAEGKPYNFALITGGNSDHAYRYFMEIWGFPPVQIENLILDPERKTVTDQLLIVCEDPNCEPLGNPTWEVAGFGRAEIAGVWDVSVVKIYRLIRYIEPVQK